MKNCDALYNNGSVRQLYLLLQHHVLKIITGQGVICRIFSTRGPKYKRFVPGRTFVPITIRSILFRVTVSEIFSSTLFPLTTRASVVTSYASPSFFSSFTVSLANKVLF